MKLNKAKVFKKCGNVLESLELSVTSVNVNSTCFWINENNVVFNAF